MKDAKLPQAEEDGADVPTHWNQGGYRIVYTTCDEELMTTVFDGLHDKISKITKLDETLSNNQKGKQVESYWMGPIDQYIKKKHRTV